MSAAAALDGNLSLSMMLGSRKAEDLYRDPRLLVHSIVTGPDGSEGEVKIRGKAVGETDPTLQGRYAKAVGEALGWHPTVGRFHLFMVNIGSVSVVRYSERGDQHVCTWPPGREYVRPIISSTEVGRPVPIRDLLVDPGPGPET